MSELYHVAKPDGTKCGQMDKAEIQAKIESGELPADTLIWKEGWADWQSVTTLCPPPVAHGSWGPVSALKSVYWKRYFDFHGRASRSEYWYAVLGAIILMILFLIISGIAMGALLTLSGNEGTLLGIALMYLLLLVPMLYGIIPGISLMVRRLHDIGLSGWFYLLGFIPYVGSLILIICACIPSTGPNKWGAHAEEPIE